MEHPSTESSMAPAMALALAANFGSVERWREQFRACPGWALLCFQPGDGTLVNRSAGGPTDAVAGGITLLSLARDSAIENIQWDGVYARYQHAVEAASEGLGAEQSQVEGALLFDVRRAGIFEQAGQMIPGATWRDPAAIGEWARSLPRDREIVVYCIYGHEVGRGTALRLRSQGLKARFLRGGIDGWKSAGLPLVDKPALS
jgi:Fe-Mn family superoxide dismutase